MKIGYLYELSEDLIRLLIFLKKIQKPLIPMVVVQITFHII